MATYSSHRLIMGKVEICKFFFCLNGYIWIFFTEMFIELSSMFHMTFVQIGVFDWLSGWQKGSIFEKNVQKSSTQKPYGGCSRNLAYLLRTLPSTKVTFLFRSV